MVDQGDTIYFQDSYGYPPDAPITRGLVPYDQKNYPLYLSKLIQTNTKKFDYNKIDYQSKNPNTGDCGRHACIKCLLKDVPNDKFRQMFFNNQNPYLTSEQLNSRLIAPSINPENYRNMVPGVKM